ncbi:MAG TPA: futalosine hydrolase [Desulfuromonadales bacterium]|nr:futalosine hydrolase [Desulfuromonadales bacterium]
MIALVAAVPFESELLSRSLCGSEELPGGFPLVYGDIAGQSVVLLAAGIGKANAAAATAILLSHKKIDALLNFGCGGALPGSGLRVGDLALAEAEIFGDEGALTPGGFLDMEALGLPLHVETGQRYYNRLLCDRSLAEQVRPLLREFAAEFGRRLVEGPFVTISCGSGIEKSGRELAARTGGICENMEGAAILQVCRRFGVPSLELRGISNRTVDRDLSGWDLKGAAAIAEKAVQRLLERWPGGKADL